MMGKDEPVAEAARDTAFEPRDPDFESRVRSSFRRQALMELIGAEITRLTPGHCEIALAYRDDLTQQHGFFHGGVVGAIADNAAGYAAFSLMAAADSVLTVEYKLNLMVPSDGDRLIARADVVRPGRTLSVARSDVFVVKDGTEKLTATALVTLMTLADRPDSPHDPASRVRMAAEYR